MSVPEPGDVTRLLHSWNSGDKAALEQLMPLVYRELNRLAAAYLRRERPNHTLQPTDLVHEAYLRMVSQTTAEYENRTHFFAVAANLMRQILVNHAVRRRAAKRGGGNQVTLVETAGLVQPRAVDLLALDEALEKLSGLDVRQGRIVELRFFGGLTEEQIASVLDVAVVTVKRDWRTARALLNHMLGGGVLDSGGPS